MKRSLLALGVVLAGGGAARGGAGEGIQIQNLQLSPYVEVRAFYDSNIFLDPAGEEQDDIAYAAQPGLRFVQETDTLRLTGHGFYYVERYTDVTTADDEDYGVELSLETGTREATRLRADASYRQTDETDRETGTIEGRDLFDASARVTRALTDKMDGEAGYAYRRTDYDDPLFFSRDEHRVRLRLLRALTDKTSGYLSGDYARQQSDGSAQDSDEVDLRAGLRSETSDKLTFDLAVGWRDHSDTNTGGLSYDVKADWRATEKVTVSAHGRNEIVPSAEEENNFNLVTTLGLNIAHRLTEYFTTTLRAAYHRNELDRDVLVDGVARNKKSDTVTLGLRADYTAPVEWWDLFGEVQYEDRRSTLDDEYDQVIAALGLVLRY